MRRMRATWRHEKTVSDTINRYIRNTRSKTIGVTARSFVFRRHPVEPDRGDFLTTSGRHARAELVRRIVQYWRVITLGADSARSWRWASPAGPHWLPRDGLLQAMPVVGEGLVHAVARDGAVRRLALFYKLMPNTHVPWRRGRGRIARRGGLVFEHRSASLTFRAW